LKVRAALSSPLLDSLGLSDRIGPAESYFDDSQACFAAIAESYDRLQPVIAGPGYQAGLDFVLKLVPHEP